MAFGKSKQPKEPKAPKEPKVTDNNNSASVKEQKLPKASKKVKNPRKLAEKFEQDLPEVARRLGIRVSSPYGYYPEDVDKHILDLEDQVRHLTAENQQLTADYTQSKRNEIDLQTELNKLRIQMSTQVYPDVTPEQASVIYDRVPTLSGKPPLGGSNNMATPKPTKISTPLKLKVAGGDATPSQDEPHTFNNLLKPRNKKQGE